MDEIYFIADYGKVYNVWSLPRGEARLLRWTDAQTGVREMSAPVGGQMLLATIEPDGDVLRSVRLPAEPLERRTAQVQETNGPVESAEPATQADRPYSPWSSLRPRSWLPLISIGDGAVAVGV